MSRLAGEVYMAKKTVKKGKKLAGAKTLETVSNLRMIR